MSIYKKLFEAKKEIGKISKDSTNPFFKSKYFDINGLLEHVEPILQKNDLVLLQPIENGFVHTIIVDVTDGTDVRSSLALPNIQDPQKLGSAITYYRRYTAQSLLGLQAQDDDGNTATKQVKVERKPSLTIEQFDKAKKATEVQMQTVIDKFRMSTEQRETLTKLISLKNVIK
tara:strand:+ start:709 stop:1227 length:519 start_codon:yes stop_codon:yes gene_type:complete